MAENKKSFVLYADLIGRIEHLTSEEKGVLFQHLLEYVNDLNPVLEDRILIGVWKPIEQQLKRDLKKFEEVKLKRSEAGKESARLRALKKNKQSSTNPTSVEVVQQSSTNPTVNDSGNVNDNVSVINNIYEKFVDEVKNNNFDTRIESLYMRLKLKQGSLTPMLKDFKLHITEQNRVHKTTEDFFLNFINWLNTQDRLKKLDKYKN